MKKRVKSFLSILLALILVIGSPGIDMITASAEESVDASYVLHYDSGEDGVKTYVYAALQNIDHSYEDSEANTKWNYTHTCAVFNLVNTTNGGSIAAYCTDVDTSAKSDTYYRRINLEDSSYHADGSAAKIRSVVLNSFPYKYDETTISGLQDDVNNWLESQSETKVEDLTVGDALTATQLAIWKLTHGDKYTVGDFYSGWGLEYSSADALNALKGRSIYTENLTENNPNSDETTEANVRLLYNYLMSLEGTDPKDDAISEFSFENIHFDITENETSYDVTVYVTVNATIDSSDDLTLAAVCGGTTQEKNLTQAGEYSFTFSGLTDLTEITLKITGTQTGDRKSVV